MHVWATRSSEIYEGHTNPADVGTCKKMGLDSVGLCKYAYVYKRIYVFVTCNSKMYEGQVYTIYVVARSWRYGVATVSRIDEIIGLFCRI